MLRLGLRLSPCASGREALTRLLVTALAVGDRCRDHALRAGRLSRLPGQQQPAVLGVHAGPMLERPATPSPRAELWNYSDDIFRRPDHRAARRRALGPHAPVPPGMSRLPGAGQYYASPALAALLRTVPRDQLGARFPGWLVGHHRRQALTGPDELVIYVGDPPRRAGRAARTRSGSTQIATAPGKQVWSPLLPRRVRRRRARVPVPDPDPDRHCHQAGGRPPGGALRGAPAGRRDPAADQRHRLGRRHRQRAARRDPRHRALRAAAAGAGAPRSPAPGISPARSRRRPVATSPCSPAVPVGGGHRGAAVAAPGADLAAGRGRQGHPAAAERLAGAAAADRRRPVRRRHGAHQPPVHRRPRPSLAC